MSRKINVLQVGLGFIGGRYKEVLDDRVDKYSIKRLESGVTPLFESPSNESITLSQLPNKIQALVVFAYSEKRKENFDILDKPTTKEITRAKIALKTVKIIVVIVPSIRMG